MILCQPAHTCDRQGILCPTLCCFEHVKTTRRSETLLTFSKTCYNKFSGDLESEILPGLNQFSFHAPFPVPAAVKLVEGSATRTSSSEGAHASVGACCQKGRFSRYLLGLRRSTLRPACQQPTVLKTEKVQQEHFAELPM